MVNKEGIIIDKKTQPLVKLFAVGDCLPGGRTEKYFISGETDYLLGEIGEFFSEADLVLFNLEAPMCVNGSPISKCGLNFRVDPRTAIGFKQAGFNVATLSNNHIFDYGAKGLEETLKALNEVEIFAHGAGNSHEEATQPLNIEANGVTITFLNYAEGEFSRLGSNNSGAAPLDLPNNKAAIEKARDSSDIVIVSVHAGNEYLHFPSPWIQKNYRQFISYGATVVIGHHPHIPQGIEWYQNGLIVYSLGDFMFEYGKDVGTCVTFALEIGFDQSGIVFSRIHPIKKTSNAEMLLLEGYERDFIINHIRRISSPLSNKEYLQKLWEQGIIRKFEGFYYTKLKEHLLSINLKDPKECFGAVFLYNMLDCQSHLKALKDTFELIYTGNYVKNNTLQQYIHLLDKGLEIFNHEGQSSIYYSSSPLKRRLKKLYKDFLDHNIYVDIKSRFKALKWHSKL